MSSQRIYFQELKVYASKRLPCPICTKKLKRQKKFSMTLSPFNINPATGLPRMSSEIYEALGKMAKAWESDPEYCVDCLDKLRLIP